MFKLEFSTTNAAFQDGELPLSFEVARCLADVVDDVKSGLLRGTVIDANGNGVGRWELS